MFWDQVQLKIEAAGVLLTCEGCQGESRGVDPQVLEENEGGAPELSPDPLVTQDVVAEDLLGDGRSGH